MDNQDQLIDWVSKISEKQNSLSTSITELKSRNEEQSKKYTATKKAKGTSERLQRINKISEMTSYSGLAQMTSVRAPAPAPPRNIFSNFLAPAPAPATNTNQLYTTVSEAQTTRSRALMDVVGKTSRNMQNQAQYSNQYNDEEDEADDRNLEELERTLALEVQAILPSPAPAASSTTYAQPTNTTSNTTNSNTTTEENTYDIASLLKELYTEPSDPDELVSKFTLYENFLNTVTAIREITLTFWSQNSDLFPSGTIRSRLQREIDHIDSPTNLHGSDDNDGRWFVCGMVEGAAKNSRMISNILNSMKQLLEKLEKGVYIVMHTIIHRYTYI